MSRPTIICLTPVKNEAWILERFLKCASLWADHIIIADQLSDDGSREIVNRFSKAILIDNPSTTFNEGERQKILLEAARRIPGPRLLIALDADEFLTSNFLTNPEWHTVLEAPAGTLIRFEWPIILSDVQSYWLYPHEFIFGFMDDESEHLPKDIHSVRLPNPPHARELCLRNVKVMHYVGVDPLRWKSKLRWYQCWEWLNRPETSPIKLYRMYHKDLDIPLDKIKKIPKKWLRGYEQQGIDMTSVYREKNYRWDKEVLQLFSQHHPKEFKKLAIWDVHWSRIYQSIYSNQPEVDLSDPRNLFDRLVHKWLKRTHPYYSHFKKQPSIYLQLYFTAIHKILRRLGW